MATQKKISKRHWAASLLALALVETAHAPLIDGATASEKNAPTGQPTAAAYQKPTEADKKLPPSPEVAPVAALTPPQELAKPPFASPLEATPTQPISLLHTASSDESAPTLGAPVAESNPVAADPASVDAVPPATPNPISEPVLGDPGNPTNPVVGVTPDPIVAVPEPGGISILLGGLMLLGRQRLRV